MLALLYEEVVRIPTTSLGFKGFRALLNHHVDGKPGVLPRRLLELEVAH